MLDETCSYTDTLPLTHTHQLTDTHRNPKHMTGSLPLPRLLLRTPHPAHTQLTHQPTLINEPTKEQRARTLPHTPAHTYTQVHVPAHTAKNGFGSHWSTQTSQHACTHTHAHSLSLSLKHLHSCEQTPTHLGLRRYNLGHGGTASCGQRCQAGDRARSQAPSHGHPRSSTQPW